MSDAYQGGYPGPAHNAYRRLTRPADSPTGPTPSPSPRPPAYLGRQQPAGEPACSRCHAWASCCFCSADPDGMRAALRRIAELHSGCEHTMCPERARLATIPRTHRPAE